MPYKLLAYYMLTWLKRSVLQVRSYLEPSLCLDRPSSKKLLGVVLEAPNPSFEDLICNSSSLSFNWAPSLDSPHLLLRLTVISVVRKMTLFNLMSPSMSLLLFASRSLSSSMNVVRLNGPRLPLVFLTLLLALAELPMVFGISSVRGIFDFWVENPNLCATDRNNGRSVARLPAVIARACSVVDQIAISNVAPVPIGLVMEHFVPNFIDTTKGRDRESQRKNLHKKSGSLNLSI